MAKLDLDEVKAWVSGAIALHAHDLISALAHRYQVSNATASATIKKLEKSGLITRSGPVNRPVFEPSSNLVLMHSYSLPVKDVEQIWQQDFAPFMLQDLTKKQQQLVQASFAAFVNNASSHARGNTLHIIVEQLLSNIEMTFQDNGVGVFKQLALAHPEMTTATELLNAQMETHPNRSITVLAPQFDYFQIEANGLHFPEELAPLAPLAPELAAENAEEFFDQGTTVIMGLTLN